MTQTEHALEKLFINRLQEAGYQYVNVSNQEDLISNLKTQLEIHNKADLEKNNKTQFSDQEWKQIENLLSKGSVLEKAKLLREEKHLIILDNGDSIYINLLNTKHWCQNQYQVTSQVTQEGTYKNRYDVTILINGLPLVQIELKRRGLELAEAFNQINRYKKHSYDAGIGLFRFVQLFVISNGVNTKYFSNFGKNKQDFLQTFHWTDQQNKQYNDLLTEFTDVFLAPCHLSKIISKYMVITTDNRLMVLRPYQYYAVENIVKKVKDNEILNGYDINKNGYIWHTTGSGKTLTSFKASQILSEIPTIKKVVFVVDRKDLDSQTKIEYDKFSKGSVDSAENTADLIKQFNAPNVRIIVTTIQKLNIAISRKNNLQKMESVQHQRMVFIFDECHRSQFGETHKNIVKFFSNIQLFGFTGTPILAENANGTKTTASLFGKCLHKYIITDAIRDQNVLKFSIEYDSTFKIKGKVVDIMVKGIDKQEVLESPKRKEIIVDYIIEYHSQKTQGKKFCAMMCTRSVDSLIDYYNIFKDKKEKGEHDLKITTIFHYTQNEDENETQKINVSINPETGEEEYYNLHRRDILESCVKDFNQMYGEQHSVKTIDGFYNYYDAVSKKSKENQTDILLVVKIFLTGFDNKYLNTLYVDKHLEYHGLVQAFSRTNRIFGKDKTQGNIVCFLPYLKNKTDQAITLFSNKDAIDQIILVPYKDCVKQFNEAVVKLLKIAPEPRSVDDLQTEEDILKFIKAFRELIRLLKKMEHYNNFSWDDLQIDEQTFADYKSKYLDIKDNITIKVGEKVSILNDIDFEIELIQQDNMNVTYILKLLMQLKFNGGKEKIKIETIYNLIETEPKLRSKKELIYKFIEEILPYIKNKEDFKSEFHKFWEEEKQKSFQEIITSENLYEQQTQKLIDDYLFHKRKPFDHEIIALRKEQKPKVELYAEIGDRIWEKITKYIEIFLQDAL